MIKRLSIVLVTAVFVISSAGCATIIGPMVSREEIDQAREELKVKALAFQIKQLQKINDVGNKVISSVGEEDVKTEPEPFLGVVAVKIDKYLRQLYDVSGSQTVIIVVVRKGSAAYAAGVKPGDVIASINGKKIRDIRQFARVASKFKIGDIVQIDILRKEEKKVFNIKIGSMPVNLPLVMVDMQEANAATDGKAIYITRGLLYFIKSDDELAAVIAHELAHAVRNHVIKMQGTQLIGTIVALVLGSAADSGAPGTGEGVARGVSYLSNIFSAGYSRDLEREADYFSVKFVYNAGFDADVCATLHERFAVEIPASMIESYLSTHPSSPERMLRVRKIIEELKAGKEPSSNYGKGQRQ
ncbi:MAG: M48 family metalloprotease [Candidatus Omnitrophota bacterium]|nr:MAG: M48 family metalloprotease [Candidatus Omnitrophota bacterium]